jgi:hypothetical protein
MIEPPTGMFDGPEGQRLYEAALHAVADRHECRIHGRTSWQFDRYEYEYPGGQRIGVRMVVAVCPECGQIRSDNANRLEGAIM